MEALLFLVLIIPVAILAWAVDRKSDDLFDLEDDDF